MMRSQTFAITSLRELNLQLDEERAAWDWARHYALIWTEEMERSAVWALNSYEQYHMEMLQRRGGGAPPRKAAAPTAPRKTETLSDFLKRRK
jgi:hypothetical protein